MLANLNKECNKYFSNIYGFITFTDKNIDTTTESYADSQKYSGERVYTNYLKPYLQNKTAKRILEVGCGVGQVVNSLLKDGYDAYGIDLPNLSKYWAEMGNDPQRFFCSDAIRIPFPDNYFDFVYSLGVIEHIGTVTGHCTLAENYREIRQRYADEIVRVTKKDGAILIASPNKRFPIDVQHGVCDTLTPVTLVNKARDYIYQRTGVNIHSILGKNHLLSYAECRELFCSKGSNISRPLPVKGYFGFAKFQTGFLRPFKFFVNAYIEHLPRVLYSGFLNPYVLIEVIKK